MVPIAKPTTKVDEPMHAKLSAVTYRDMEVLFHGKGDGTVRKIGNNTAATIWRGADSGGGPNVFFEVHLYGHLIVELAKDGIWFSNAGYPTATTRDRLNSFGWSYGIRFSQRKREQYVRVRGEGESEFTGTLHHSGNRWGGTGR